MAEKKRRDSGYLALDFTRAFAAACDDLDPFGLYLLGVIKFEGDVLDDEGPDIVTEAVGIQMALRLRERSTLHRHTHLEAHALLHLFGEHVCDGFVKVADDLHGQLRLDLSLGDQVVDGIRES